jgi:hypothetical protein
MANPPGIPYVLRILRMMSNADLSRDGTLQESTTSRRPSLPYVIVASLVAVFLYLRWGTIREGIWIDLDVYIRGAGALIRHEPLYGVSVQGQPFTYTPSLLCSSSLSSCWGMSTHAGL